MVFEIAVRADDRLAVPVVSLLGLEILELFFPFFLALLDDFVPPRHLIRRRRAPGLP